MPCSCHGHATVGPRLSRSRAKCVPLARLQVTAWALDILSFKSILMGKANNDADMQVHAATPCDHVHMH